MGMGCEWLRARSGAVSVTVIEFRRCWQPAQAARRYRALAARLRGLGYDLQTMSAIELRARRAVFVTIAPSEDVLRRAAATAEHVSAVRWVIARRANLWSGVFGLSGWSSMSGPRDGVWSDRSAINEAGLKVARPREAGGDLPP